MEYHGPHLSLANDAIISYGASRQLHRMVQDLERRESPFLWAGEIGMGVDPVPGPGSQPFSVAAVREAVSRTCRGLASLGAKKLVLVTFHGAPLHNSALDQVVRQLEGDGIRAYAPATTLFSLFLNPDLDRFSPVYETVPAEAQVELRERLLQDFHAGFLETSLALHFAPETVQDHRLTPPCPRTNPEPALVRLASLARLGGRLQLAHELLFAAEATAWYRLKPFPGYTSMPAFATARAGSILADLALADCALAARAVLAGELESPRPIMRWMHSLTLGGRLTRPR
jgi:creatinine amidohydrolase